VRLSVGYSPLARDQLVELRARAERSPGTNHEKILEGLRKVLEALELDMVAFHRGNALGRDLSNVWREKFGRWRLFYLASREKQRVLVLMLGPGRKAGDKNDPYVEFKRRLKRGDFDPQFAELGVTKPKP
jgi:mRNA-degrading endonuclease RelE of RelBE toxin-antitoxin system